MARHTLFVGGANDGRWVDVPEDAQHFRLAVLPTIYHARMPDDARALMNSVHAITEDYRRRQLSVDGRSFFFFALESLSNAEAMELILFGYESQQRTVQLHARG